MELSELDMLLLEICKTPKTSKEAAKEAEASLKTVQTKLGRLRKRGLMSVARHELSKPPYFAIRYETIENATPKEPKKPYEPVGMCIFGVWM